MLGAARATHVPCHLPIVLCAADKYEDLQRWLMDPIACPTEWPELLRIRRENANYKIGTVSNYNSPAE